MQQYGCFGVPSIFSFRSQTCGGCKDRAGCQASVHAALRAAPSSGSVTALLREFDAEEVGTAPDLPKKVAATLAKLVRGGVKEALQRAIENGHNPFNPDKQRSLHGAFSLLERGPFSKSELVTHFVGALGWTKNAAKTEVTTVWRLLPALGIAQERDGRLFVVPRPQSHNVRING